MKELSFSLKETGILVDYLNEFLGLQLIYSLGNKKEISRSIIDHPIPPYEAKYGKDSVNDNNRKRVEALNEIADLANRTLSNPDFDDEKFKEIINNAYILIRGEDARVPY